MDDCSFCQDYETTLKVNARAIRECEKEGIKRRYKYRIRLVEFPENYVYSWQPCGEYGHKPVPFYYCPVCGKRLVKVK